MKLPSKKSLRKAIEAFTELPKSVLSYFNKGGDKELAVVGKTLSAENKRVYALFIYSAKELKYVAFVDREFNFMVYHLKSPESAAKWLTTFRNSLRDAQNYYDRSYILLSCTGFYSYFRLDDKGKNPISFITTNRGNKMWAERDVNTVLNTKRRNNEFESNYRPIHNGFVKWGYNRFNLGWFDVNERRTCHCTECSTSFDTNEELKKGHTIKCPNCKKELTLFTKKTIPNSKEWGGQYLDKTKDNLLVVRHTLFQKSYDKATGSLKKHGFWEYERDLFVKNKEYYFTYHVSRWNGTVNQYVWYHKKPYYGTMISMRELCYCDEPIYRGNTKSIQQAFNEVNFSQVFNLPENLNIRAESYLVKYSSAPLVFESLIKQGYYSIAINSDLSKFKYESSTKKVFFGISKEYKEYLKNTRYLFDTNDLKFGELIKTAQDMHIKPHELDRYIDLIPKKVFRNRGFAFDNKSMVLQFLKKCEWFNVSVHKAVKYLSENDYYMWKDYCQWSVEMFGKPKRNKLFPSNLKTAHDNLYEDYEAHQEELKAKELARKNELCSQLFSQLEKAGAGNMELKHGYSVVVPKSKEDFSKEGHDLDICVGGWGYFDAHTGHTSLIFFIRMSNDIDTSYCCCEAKVRKEQFVLSQCRLASNKDAPEMVQNEAQRYINKLNKVVEFKNNHYYLKAA